MSTTTIRLPKDLKARVAAAAERAGTTAHSFILEAIAEKAEQAKRRADFQDVAEKRYAGLVASGKTIPWERMRKYLESTPTQSTNWKTRIGNHEGAGHRTQSPWLRGVIPLHRADRHGLRARNS